MGPHRIPLFIDQNSLLRFAVEVLMQALNLFAIMLALASAQAQTLPGGVSPAASPALPTSPASTVPGRPGTNPAISPGAPSAPTPGAPVAHVGALPGTTNGVGSTINTVSGPCNPNIPSVVAPLGSIGTTPSAASTGGSVSTTGIPEVSATVGGALGTTTVIGNTKLNTPGPATGITTVAQPCVVGPAGPLPTPKPSPTP
jgi:hypothetical protein